MKAFLMYKDHDFDRQRKLPPNEHALTQDLDLTTLFTAMSHDDAFLSEMARKAVLSSLDDLDTIRYRQSILKDSLKNPFIVRELYHIATESIANEKKIYSGMFISEYPNATLHRSMQVLQLFVVNLKKLKKIADEHADKFESEGITAFFAMLNKELDDEYFASVQNHLKKLEFRDGVLISAELGKGNKGNHYTLRRAQDKKQSWVKRISAKKPVYTITISDRDESGARALSELQDKGIIFVANTLAQSTEHILSFFRMLRTELAFYIGCLNLHQQLDRKGEPLSFPLPVVHGECKHSFRGLYDICLALRVKQRIEGNDMDADKKDLVIITGANQGGKSTFLRSIGLSQLMMQCGMFAPAEHFSSNVYDALFTHYKREEDTAMNSGKLDEELSRMSEIAETMTSNSILLFNESFAATNEREGSEIARQITNAFLEKHVKVFFVTHLYDFAHGLYEKKLENVIFLRADRQTDGGRTFKVLEGEPLQTSHGEDLYNRIFETIPRAAPATPTDTGV